MENQPEANVPSDMGSEGQPEGRADLLLPNLTKATNVPSLDQPFPTNLNFPPSAFFPGNLNLPSAFPVLPAQMQQYLDYDSQPLWAGNGVPNLDSFLPMPQFPGQIVTPPAGGGFGFHPAGATVNPFASDPYAQFPPAPFVDFGSNQFNLAMDPMQMPAEPLEKGEDKTSSIPLICILCPNKPTFSDQSHLLTHVSSKSHLAAQFKLQHSGKIEDKRTLDGYKLWSDNNGVDKLVANRIAAKELKKSAKKQRLATIEASKKTGKNIKDEADDSLGARLENTPLRPNPNLWHLHAPRDNSFETLYGTPSYNDHSAYPLPDSPQSSAYIKRETSRSGTETANTSFLAEAADVDDGDCGDASKLKGTIYPGMGLFDAATPLQKRKRNQKKHASVVRNMEITSASIGPEEEVWDITMSEVTRTRNVYDSPSIDGSPDSKDELPSTTKKRRSRRPAVANPGPRRQTRAVTRAANTAKVGKRRSARQANKLIKVEDELDSEDDSSHRLDDEEGEDNVAAGDDVFQEHRQIRQDAPGPASGNRFDISFRNAMNNLPSNTPLMASSSLFTRPSQGFFPGFGMKENDSMAFPMHQPSAMHGYFPQNRQNMQASTSGFNPLYLQRQDNYPFLYSGHSFEASKPSTPAFQTVNSADFAGMDSNPSFQPGQAQQDDFDV
ncbi:hypothetical protein INS49_007919 [Diaporthe citri]|uniref:uncharacterized protein n=1 Tax=Diaporthe citri TaxID=83186 RepID=UPI001C819925|nr:uncharacterized protein INS49_007919 [Diaporthe citri]KAG6362825.1 hypothetical protein INS49_007919 [Diaporthe citri]